LRTVAVLVCLLFVFLAGCAGTKSAVPSKEEYVEIDNPGYTMSPNASPTIWVPRRYVESGVPRGGELVKQGYEAAKSSLTAGRNPQEKQARIVPPPAAVSVPVIKNRIAVLEVGKNGLAAPFSEMLKKTSSVIIPDPSQIAILGRYAALATQAEKNTFAVRLQEDFSANLVTFMSAPDGIAQGKVLKAEIFDGMGGGLVRVVEASLPQYSANEQSARESAVSATLMKLIEQTREVLSLLPWYGKVVAVEGDRIYINAGKEAGIQLGQTLKVYRGGKVVQGLGFAPGKMIGTAEIAGFVGTNGAYGIVKEGVGVLVSDLVSVE
jgi:hypothetical protein